MTAIPQASRSYAGLGLLLVVPAVLMALISLVLPTGQTIVRSFQHTTRFGRSPEFTGLDNYNELLGHNEFWEALGFSLSLVVIPLLVIVVVAPLLATALDLAGTPLRRTGRVLLSVPLVVFSPVAVAVAWVQGQTPVKSGGIATMFGHLNDADAKGTVILITAAASFGLACGLGLLVFLPALRGREAGQTVPPAMLVVGAIVVLAGIAAGLQAFSFSFVTGGGPLRSTQTLAMLQYTQSMVTLEFGVGSAAATITGLILGVLGVAATLIAIVTRLRVSLSPVGQDRAAPSAGVVILAAGALIAIVALAIVGSWPWLSAFASSSDAPLPDSSARIYANTWIPAIAGAIISVGIAYVAALGIGGLRPLREYSEWLLMPFAPWLFVGVTPLSLAGYENMRDLDLLGSSISRMSPILVSVPAMLILTLFCRGQALRWHEQLAAGAAPTASFFRTVAVPALPLAGLLTGAVTLLNAQNLGWPLLMSAKSAPVTLTLQMRRYFAGDATIGLTTPLVAVILALIALIALQVLYLDRLTIKVGSSRQGTGLQ